MESMTGYAIVEKNTEQFSFSVGMKSLNSRYLEIHVNLPRILKSEENNIINIIKENVTRGKVEVNIEVFDWTDIKPISLNKKLLVKYYEELNELSYKLNIDEPIRLDSLLKLDGVTTKEKSVISEKSNKDIYLALGVVVKKMLRMRKDEGMATKKDIVNSLKEINKSVVQIKSKSKEIVEIKKNDLNSRIEALINGVPDKIRMYTEIAILADKLDINEEIVRLNDHLKKFKVIINESDQIGKKLDFILQEIFREINTIGSKSNSSDISHLVVEVKNNVDRIREQCRNIV